MPLYSMLDRIIRKFSRVARLKSPVFSRKLALYQGAKLEFGVPVVFHDKVQRTKAIRYEMRPT